MTPYIAEARVIQPGGAEKIAVPENGSHFSLEELRGFVGGHIELVRVSADIEMMIDEEGKLKGKPINATATDISRLYPHDVIVGVAVVGHPNVFRNKTEKV